MEPVTPDVRPLSLSAFRDRHRGETIIVCGCGRSLNDLPEPAHYVTIGVNDVGRRFDPTYLVVVNPPGQFTGGRFRHVAESRARFLFTCRDDLGAVRPDLVRFPLGRFGGTDFDQPDVLHYAQNSPYVALCLAARMGAARIGLIGVDFTEDHFFAQTGPHPLAAQLTTIDRQYAALGHALRPRGVTVVNLSAQSRLTAFPKVAVGDFLARVPTTRALDIVSYATTPVAGVPAILARCIASVTPHKARCVWARDDYGNGVAFDGDVEWNRSPVEAERLIDAADLVIVHNGKVDPAHRRLFARKPVVTMAHNYIWNVDCGFVDAGFPGVVVGQYQATLPEFSGWSVVPNPIPLWEPAYQPDVKPDVVTIAYTPSGRHESFPPGHKLWWHAKGYDTTMRVLHRLAERHAIRLRVIGDKQISHASALAMKRGAHIVIDECVTGSYHRNSLEGLATGAIVINGVGLRPEIGDMLRICSGGAELPFGFATLETLEQELERLICLGAPALTQRGAAARLWMERHWQFATQWERNWQPMLDAALARSAGRALIPPSIERPVSIVIPHGGRERLDLLGMTLTAAARCGAVAEIIVAEMDDAPHARDLVQHLGYSHVFIRRDAGFNKARAINVATELAVGELVLWLDNDLLLPDGFLDRAVAELRRRDLDCLIPWTSVHYLNSDDSSALVAGTKRLEQCRPVNAYHTRSGACGGAVLLRRRLVRDFGGMCEAFRGWGGEDNAWFHKARVVGKAAITARADQHLHHLFHPLSGGYGTPEHIAANPHYQANVALLYEMRRVTDRARFMASWPPPERAPCPWDREKTIALVAEPGDVWVQERSSTVRTSLHERYGIQATEQTPCNDPNADAVIFFRSGDAPCEVRDQPFRARSVVVRRTRVGIAPERDTAYHLDGDHPDFARALIAPLSVILGTHAPPRAAAQVCVGAGTALVAAASGIGDLIRVTPLIRVLARLGHRVDFLIAPDYPDSAELFRGAPEINRVIMHPPLTARAPPRQIAELAGVNYESAIFGYLAAAFAPGVAATDRHVVDRERWLTEGDSKCAERIARELGWREAMPAPIAVASSRRFDLPDGTVVLHPGCKRNWPWKRWHGFADLAAMLPEVAIVGTEEDRTNAGTYFGDRHAWPAHVRDYTGTLSLPDTAALIGQAAAVVSNDSGLMHLAVAVGTPTFGVFGITNPAREIIPAPHMHVVTKGLPCEAPCRGQPQGRRDCEHHLRCLKQLTAAEVIESMNHLLPVQRPVMPVPRRPAANIDTVEVLTIAIQIEGGLGDIMIAASFVEALWLTLGRCVIDVFHQTPDWAKFVFHDTRFVRNVLPAASHRVTSARYDIAAYLPQYVHYRVHDWPKLERLNPGAANMIRVANERFEQHRGLFDRRPNLDGLWGRLSVASGRTVFTNLGYLGGIASADRLLRYLAPDPSACEPAMRLIGADGDRYVTVHDGFDTTQKVAAGTATKCWPIDKWNDFVARFKAAFPAVRVVQVGAGKSRPIGGVDVNLLGRTSLHQVAWLLKHAALHIDTDSGLVHLAHAMHTRSIALFGPTDKEFYGYAGNGNLGGEVCGKCWWSTPDWLARCPRGLKQPECMTSIAPEQVLDEARRMLGTHRPAAWQLVARKLYDTVPEQAEGSILHSMFAGLTLPSVPITRHAIEPDSGIYMHASKQWEYPWVLGQIASLGETRGPLTTADIGGGRGALAPYLAKLGHRVEVFDRDYLWDHGGDTGVEARYRLLAAAQGYTARFGSLYNLPAEDAAYDVVVSVSVVEHVQHKHQAMSELLRLVKPGGLLILTFDFAREPARFQDGSRLEIFGPELLATTLSGFGIGSPDFNDAEIAESASAIQRDGVLGIPAGMTVGGIAIRTECEQ
jgi:ADP-heptose:LPS heptosyltransferase/SAM-dependent methyltransferase